MQMRTWRQALRKIGGAAVLLAVPALALGVFAPRSWQSLAAAAPVMTPTVASAPARLAAAAETVAVTDEAIELNDWAETFNPSAAQVAALDANLGKDRASFRAQRNARYAAIQARYRAKYKGNNLRHYLVLAYKNLSIENFNFEKFERDKIIALYRDGVVSASTYTFVALK